MRLASIILMCCLPFATWAQERAALVIGMGDYANAKDLDGPRTDARALGSALDGLGFDVTTLIDTPGTELKQAISDFAFEAETADIAVIYYAGHRISAGGENFLVPVDSALAPLDALRKQSVALPLVLRAAGKARKMRIVILDNCQAVPLNSIAPLSPPEPRPGTLVLTSGRVGACDSGSDGPGVFVASVIDAFSKPDVEMSVMLEGLRADLRSRSGGALAPRRFGRLEAVPYVINAQKDDASLPQAGNVRRNLWSHLSDAQNADLAALARQGDTRALLASAYVLLDPDSPRHDPAGAAENLQRAMRSGSAEATFQLAQLYEEGLGVPQDHARALALYQQAAERGYAEALNDLGFIHLQGELGLDPDADRALAYFRRAADLRHPPAMFNFAAMIDDGKVEGRGAPDAALYLYRALRGGDATLLDLMVSEPELFNSETRKALQRRLSRMGFYDGPIDGDYGPGTQAGIRAAYGSPATESPTPALESAAAAAEPDPNAPQSPAPEAETDPESSSTDDAEPLGTEETGQEALAGADPEPSAEPSGAVAADATPEPGADTDVTPVLRPKQAARD